jgi:hypothetical protein
VRGHPRPASSAVTVPLTRNVSLGGTKGPYRRRERPGDGDQRENRSTRPCGRARGRAVVRGGRACPSSRTPGGRRRRGARDEEAGVSGGLAPATQPGCVDNVGGAEEEGIPEARDRVSADRAAPPLGPVRHRHGQRERQRRQQPRRGAGSARDRGGSGVDSHRMHLACGGATGGGPSRDSPARRGGRRAPCSWRCRDTTPWRIPTGA